ncbi:MAG: ammonia-forming cytochrome c nitrite reductase subunit c552 [Verrucomicrobiota bacterium]
MAFLKRHDGFCWLAGIVVMSAGLLVWGCGKGGDIGGHSDRGDRVEQEVTVSEAALPTGNDTAGLFVGAKKCAECHEEAFEEWAGSHHDHAMAVATEETVLGDFDDAEFDHFGVKSRFFRKDDGSFWVNTPGPDGEPTDYPIEYTFGVYPLQQYLIPFPGGRYQALQICWDSRSEEEGGQRWYHLYADEPIPHTDELHWTGPNFNWNYMCADCHSTNLRKNYDVETGEYDTQWSEMNVSCEACHGPGREHVEAAEAFAESGEWAVEDYGLAVVLKEPEEGAWVIDGETGQPKRSHPLASTVQVETCAPCHSRRRPLVDGWVPHHGLGDTHDVSLLDRILYYPDGQIKEEVYVYGSFVQSKMHQNHVRCTDCHNPHSLNLLAEGNALCVRCHDGTRYDSPAHTFHQPGSTGSSCVECHMPTTTYMGVDPRRDHSIRIPRPDLTEKIGSPNACNQCHEDQSTEWAVEWWKRWYGEPEEVHWGETLAAAYGDEPGVEERLLALAGDGEKPKIVRGAAMAELERRPPTREALQVMAGNLKDKDAMVRTAAVAGLAPLDAKQRLQFVVPMLEDEARSVRMAAVRTLASVPREMFSEEERAAFETGLAEYEAAQLVVGDRAGAHMGLGLLYTDLGEPEKAEAAYRKAFEVEENSFQARVNLAEMMFEQGRIQEAQFLLEDAVRVAPQLGITHEALARHWIRRQEYAEGLTHLLKAAELSPESAETQFFAGVALNQLGRYEDSVPYLEKAIELAPRHAEYMTGLVAVARDNGDWERAVRVAEQLVAVYPEEAGYRALLEEMRGRQAAPGR